MKIAEQNSSRTEGFTDDILKILLDRASKQKVKRKEKKHRKVSKVPPPEHKQSKKSYVQIHIRRDEKICEIAPVRFNRRQRHLVRIDQVFPITFTKNEEVTFTKRRVNGCP